MNINRAVVKAMAGCALCVHLLGVQSAPLSDFQDTSGFISVLRSGESADPYFSMKALWVLSHDRSGATPPDEQQTAMRLLSAMRPEQQADGSFGRSCRQAPDLPWTTCNTADADDLMAALWVYCVVRYAPDEPVWNASGLKALDHLARLWDPDRQVFRLFANQNDALFIDNMELLHLLPTLQHRNTLKRFRSAAASQGHTAAQSPGLALFEQLKPLRLKTGIEQTFSVSLVRDMFPHHLASPGRLPGVDFYPHLVASLYIWMSGWQPALTARSHWRQWWALTGQAWLRQEVDPYPWALTAMVASQLGPSALAQWLNVVCIHRKNIRWTVLDEAIWLRYRKQQVCDAGAAL